MVPDAVLHAAAFDAVDELAAPARPGTGRADFDACFAEAYPRLVRSVAAACGDAELAADCVADAFERAYVRWWRIGRYDDPAAWVRRVALNRAVDQHRRRVRGRRVTELLAAGEDGTDPRDPGAAVEGADPRLASGLAALPDRQRTAMLLFYAEERSVAEVAAAMGITAGAVKYHLHQGRAGLRAHLGLDPEGGAAT